MWHLTQQVQKKKCAKLTLYSAAGCCSWLRTIQQDSLQRTASALQRQFRLYIPFLGIARPQPQFHIHVFVSNLYIPRIGPHFPPAEKADTSWEYIIRSQTHECGNWDWDPNIPFSGKICFQFSAFCLCSAGRVDRGASMPIDEISPAIIFDENERVNREGSRATQQSYIPHTYSLWPVCWRSYWYWSTLHLLYLRVSRTTCHSCVCWRCYNTGTDVHITRWTVPRINCPFRVYKKSYSHCSSPRTTW